MSEVVESGGVSAGGLIRQAREAAGMHIAALAVALKVPVSKLEALESDNYAALPDTVFVRALASSICRTLKLDPAPILSRLPQSQSPRLAMDSSGLNAPVKRSAGKTSSSASSSSSFSGSASRSVSWIVLALLIGALVLVFFPRHPGQPDKAQQAEQPEQASEPVVAAKPAGDAADLPSSASTAPASALASVPPPVPAASEGAVPTAVARQGAAAASAAVNAVNGAPATAAAAASAPNAPPTGVLVLRARAESWVQVRDANGTLALQRNLTAGESVSVPGAPPFAVVVGRADATEVFVRGKPFDMATVSRENVARFEVK